MKKIILILTLLFPTTCLFPEDVTKIFQQGVEGYSGCMDSYIHNLINEDDSFEITNYGNEINLDIYYCYS